MANAFDMHARHGRVLAELTELALGIAEQLADAIEATEDVDELTALGLAFARVGRAVRLSIALEARLAREALEPPVPRAAAEPASPRAPPSDEPRPERLDYEDLRDRPEREDEILDLAELDDTTVETVIARIREDLGLTQPIAAASRTPAPRPAATPTILSMPSRPPSRPAASARASLLGGASRPPSLKLVDTS